MKTLFKFDGFTVKTKLFDSGSNYNRMVYLYEPANNNNNSPLACTTFKEHEPLANIMQWAINASKPNNFTL